jgi:hypothetical protein
MKTIYSFAIGYECINKGCVLALKSFAVAQIKRTTPVLLYRIEGQVFIPPMGLVVRRRGPRSILCQQIQPQCS